MLASAAHVGREVIRRDVGGDGLGRVVGEGLLQQVAFDAGDERGVAAAGVDQQHAAGVHVVAQGGQLGVGRGVGVGAGQVGDGGGAGPEVRDLDLA